MTDTNPSTAAPDPTPPSEASAPPAPTEQQPAMSDHCSTAPALPDDSPQPSGELLTLSSPPVQTYVSKPSSYPNTPCPLLFYLSNGAGLTSTANKLQADRFAADLGAVVLLPDLFDGDPAPSAATTVTTIQETNGIKGEEGAEVDEGGWLSGVKMKAAEGVKTFLIDMWLARHSAEKTLPLLERVVREAATGEFADAAGVGVLVVGYCFGGKYALQLLGQPWDNVVFKAGAVAHGLLVTREDFVAVKAPVSVVAVEGDPFFSDEVREEGRKVLEGQRKDGEGQGVEWEMEVYKGVPHGFAVLGNYKEAKIVDAQEKAYGQMVEWLGRFK